MTFMYRPYTKGAQHRSAEYGLRKQYIETLQARMPVSDMSRHVVDMRMGGHMYDHQQTWHQSVEL